MSRLRRVLLVVAAIGAVTAPSSAAAAPDTNLSALLGTMWTTILQAPVHDNPFGTGDPCVELGGGVVAPFAGGARFTCVVEPGTSIFVAAYSAECSTVEEPTVGGSPGALRTCADAAVDAQGDVTATLDGQPITLSRVQTGVLDFVLPEDNIFGLPTGTEGQSFGDGWVALLEPLSPGRHTIKIFLNGQLAATTTIIVQPT